MNGQRESWLVTGALGCIGAWTVVTLIREGVSVVAFDLGDDDRRLRLIALPEEIERAAFVRGDITEPDVVERVIRDHHVTHVVHLAALQVPFCRENPPLGSRVNVTGTVNVFEAAKRCDLGTTVAYAKLGCRVRRVRCNCPEDHLRGVQGGERGLCPCLLAGEPRRQRWPSTPHGVRARARSGNDRRSG